MKRNLLYLITFTVAFCSIAYELILGQTLSVFLGNTVLRFSITVGIYLFAMGVGAMIAEGKFAKNFVLNFVRIELALTLLGGFVVAIFFLLSSLMGSGILFFAVAHFLIFVIGVLTGFEIPFLMEAQKNVTKENQALVLGIDYAGAFVGSLVFAFIFYPKIGIVPAAFFVGLLNALAGVLFFVVFPEEIKKCKRYFWVLVFLVFVMIFLIFNQAKISEFFISSYLK